MGYETTKLVDYLVNSVAHKVNEEAVQAILFDRGVEVDAILEDVSKKRRELCKADLFMWCSNAPSHRGSVSDSDGDWSHKESGENITNYERASLKARAKEIYRRYGEFTPERTIQFHCRGMRIWRDRM